MAQLRATSITVENMMAISGKATLRLGSPKEGEGQLIVISGPNESGKTSFWNGILALAASDYDPTLINDNAQRATSRIMLSNGVEITRIIDFKEKSLKVDAPDGEGVEVRKLETYIKGKMGTGFGLNPLNFLCHNGTSPNAEKRKARLEYLMKALDISFSLEEIGAALDGAGAHLEDKTLVNSKKPLDLNDINKLARQLSEARGPVGTRRETAVAAAERFRKQIAQDSSQVEQKDWRAEVSRIEKAINGVNSAERNEILLIDQQVREVRKELDAQLLKNNQALADEYQRLRDIAKSGDTKAFPDINCVSAFYDQLVELANSHNKIHIALTMSKDATTNAVTGAQTKRGALEVELATAKVNVEGMVQREFIQKEYEEALAQVKSLADAWNKLDAAVKEIEKLKRSRLDNLPEALRGIEVRDGDVFYNNRQFDRLNTATQYIVAMRIGSVGAGELGIIVCDEAEHLDDKNLVMVREAVKQSGITFILFRAEHSRSKADIEKYGERSLRSEPAGALVFEAGV